MVERGADSVKAKGEAASKRVRLGERSCQCAILAVSRLSTCTALLFTQANLCLPQTEGNVEDERLGRVAAGAASLLYWPKLEHCCTRVEGGG